MVEFDKILDDLVEEGISVTVFKRDNQVFFDLHLDAKSWLHLTRTEDGWQAHMRYNDIRDIHNLDDLLDAAEYGMHGRTFINPAWRTLLQKHDYTVAS